MSINFQRKVPPSGIFASVLKMIMRNLKFAPYLSAILITLPSCQKTGDRGHSTELENQVLRSIDTALRGKKDRLQFSDISYFTPVQICFQSPYISKSEFENQTGIYSKEFKSLGDDAYYVWWLSDKLGNRAWIKVPRMKSIDQDANLEKACIDLNKYALYINCNKHCTYSIGVK